MSTKIKLSILLILVLSVSSYIVYAEWRISGLVSSNTILQSTNDQLTSVNESLSKSISSYEQATVIKDKIISDSNKKLNDMYAKLDDLYKDETNEKYLNTPIPNDIKLMLKSTDYYSRSVPQSTTSIPTK